MNHSNIVIPTGLALVKVIIPINTSAIVKQIPKSKQTLFEIILLAKKLDNGLNTKALVAVTAI